MHTVTWDNKIKITEQATEYTELGSGNAFGIYFECIHLKSIVVSFKPLNDEFPQDTFSLKNDGVLFNFERELIEEDDIEYALDIMSLFNNSKQFTITEADKTTQLNTVIKMILEEYHSKTTSFIMLKSMLKVLLLHLIRFQNATFSNQDLNQKRVFKFLKLMETSFLRETKTEYYANELGISEKRLNQILKEKLNVTAKQIIQQRQLTEAKRRLVKSEITIKELAFILGFDSMSSFSRFFKKFTTINPSSYRLNHK